MKYCLSTLTLLTAGLLMTACAEKPAPAVTPATRVEPAAISAQRLSEHVRVLASDEFGGRAPGTPGEEKTIAYLIEQFETMGIEPGGPDGSWTQTVPMIHTLLDDQGSLTVHHGEDSYPLLHDHLGHEIFHRISREYVEQDHIMACALNHIGDGFADFLADREYGRTEIDLARIEWAWLGSYRSAEAVPLALTDIAALSEDKLLAFPIAAHPAMRLIPVTGPLSPQLGELADARPDALMIARPEAEVLFHPLNAPERAIAENIADCDAMGNLLEHALEWGDEATAMQHVVKLIQAGALTRIVE